MYSEKIASVLKAKGIDIGDSIKVSSGTKSIEGVLMPSTEFNDDDMIIIKLKSGYNIGVSYHNTTITKIAKGKPSTGLPKAKITPPESLPSVQMITTGGTIGSKIDYMTGGVYSLAKPEELFYYVPEISEIANISINPLFNIMSEDLSFIEWRRMADETVKALNSGAHGVVIMQGTDTMHYTSAALSFMLQDLNAPVVITGSQRSSDRGSSDSFLNLICSTSIAARSDIAEVGICMHSSSSDDECHFIRGVKARKMHTSRRDAFRPINDRAIAYVDTKGGIRYSSQYKKTDPHPIMKVSAKTKFEPSTAIVKAYPYSDPEIIDYYLGKRYKGLIIEGTGLGHTPASTEHIGKSWVPFIANAVANGMIVGVTSQCMYGRVNSNVYTNLRLVSKAGAIHCEDMTTETAFVKLAWLLGNHTPERAKELLNKNLVGEIKKRTNYDEFLA